MHCSTRPKRVHLVSGFGGMYREQIRSVKKGDVVVAISFAPYGKETQYCVRAAQHHGAKTLVITDSQLSPLARHASAHLFVKEGSAFAFRSLTSTICLCQALFIALAYRLELNVEESRETGAMTIDVAVFGAGRIGKIHAANLARQPGVRLKYVVDVNREAAAALAAQHGAQVADVGRRDWRCIDRRDGRVFEHRYAR